VMTVNSIIKEDTLGLHHPRVMVTIGMIMETP